MGVFVLRRKYRLLDQAMLAGKGDQTRDVLNIQFVADALEVGVNGVQADGEAVGDFGNLRSGPDRTLPYH